MRFQPPKVSLESDEQLPVEEGIEYQEPENPFLDTLSNEEPVELTPEQHEVAIVETVGEVTETAAVVEDVAVAVESLEAIALHLQQLKDKDESVSVEGVALLNLSFDNAVRKFPAFKQTETVDSLENFAISPASATNVSLENIGDKIKAGYEAIVKFIKDLIAKFKELVEKVFSSAATARRAAQANIEALKTANKDRAVPSTEITIPAILNNPVLTVQGVATLEGVIKSIGSTSYDEVVAILDRADGITVEEAQSALHKAFDAYARLKDDVYLGNLSFNNDAFPPSVKLLEGSDRSARVLKLNQVQEYSQAVIKLCDELDDLRVTSRKRHVALTNLVARVKHNAKSPDAQSSLQIIRGVLQMTSKLQAFESRVMGRAIQVANAINKVCADSIKAHG